MATPRKPASSGGKEGAGRFTPGRSGNPAGRPAGSRNKATVMLDAVAEGEAAEVLRALLARARQGDAQAAGLILARCWPARRGRPVVLSLPSLGAKNGATKAVDAILKATTTGTITPEEAEALVKLVEARQRVAEMPDLVARLEALEVRLKESTS
ncbi:DUF5681 domain-containing protein [Roseomonas elaeocarpi]|uniref:DUF5681 domain-containing protein n=1 Tax=Roseomonas elaeocarpi TaxID=907779 RepID=A0ABV6JTC3_9PROT